MTYRIGHSQSVPQPLIFEGVRPGPFQGVSKLGAETAEILNQVINLNN
jgi:hypothetical protein